jgi:hypothetical protein
MIKWSFKIYRFKNQGNFRRVDTKSNFDALIINHSDQVNETPRLHEKLLDLSALIINHSYYSIVQMDDNDKSMDDTMICLYNKS